MFAQFQRAFEEYLSYRDYPTATILPRLSYRDGTDHRYGLEDGELILMNPSIGLQALNLQAGVNSPAHQAFKQELASER